MPRKLDDDVRAGIVVDLHAIAEGAAPERSTGQIAKAHGVHPTTITRIAQAENLDHIWQRCHTKKATEAARTDHASRLVSLAGRSADLAEAVLDSFDAMSLEQWRSVSPHTRGVVLGIALDKARELAPETDEAADARSALSEFMAGVRAMHRATSDQTS